MALPTLYKQWKVAKYPTVDFKPFETFHLETGVPLEKTRERQILIKTTHFSNDPAQRTWVTDKPENRHYTMPVRVGETMNSMTTGLVLESRHPDYESGDVVAGHWGWREYAVIDPDKSTGIARPRQLIKEIGPADDMALGLTAWTAYIGMLKVANVKPTDQVIVVSGAAGATGSTVVQIAKNILGIKTVIGIAGSPEKCKMLISECGCNLALNYKSPNFEQELMDATPDFIDIFFDNVGGWIMDACMKRMNVYGRVVCCGALSAYDKDETKEMVMSAESYFLIVTQKLTMQGFVIIDPQWKDDVEQSKVELGNWVAQGKLRPLKTVWRVPFEEIPKGLTKLLHGDNVGKLVTELEL